MYNNKYIVPAGKWYPAGIQQASDYSTHLIENKATKEQTWWHKDPSSSNWTVLYVYSKGPCKRLENS